MRRLSPFAAQAHPLRRAAAAIVIAAAALGAAVHGARAEGGPTGAVPDIAARYAPDRAPAGRPRLVETMREGGGVRPPAGFERFCAADPRYCRPPQLRRPGAIVPATRDLIADLDAFNRGVNAAYAPAEDIETYGVSDHWTFPTTVADCEDYVLAKQAGLIAAGWPPESVLIAVVVGELSPFHAVLVVRTSEGEFVLDNMTDELKDWRDTGYEWVIRQSTLSPERWVRVEPTEG